MVLRAHAKRILVLSALVLCFAVLAAAVWAAAVWATLPDVSWLRSPKATLEIRVLDWDGSAVPFKVGPANPSWTPLDRVAPSLIDAVVASEDFSFFSHRGVDWFEVREAIRRDMVERRPVRGASTITQQLAKNLFLSREKTIVRKAKELILARRLEKALAKERILELYLNVVELGPLVYGVGAGSAYHFRKAPSDLTLRESAFLAAMLAGPRVYDPYRRLDRVMTRADHVLAVMLKGRMISEEECRSALGQLPFLPRTTPITPSVPEAPLPDSFDDEIDEDLPAVLDTLAEPVDVPATDGTESAPAPTEARPEMDSVGEPSTPPPAPSSD